MKNDHFRFRVWIISVSRRLFAFVIFADDPNAFVLFDVFANHIDSSVEVSVLCDLAECQNQLLRLPRRIHQSADSHMEYN